MSETLFALLFLSSLAALYLGASAWASWRVHRR